MRGTKLTETRVNILLVPPLLTMETSHHARYHWKSVYISAANSSPEHFPAAQPFACTPALPQLLRVCAAGCSGSFQLVWFANSSPPHRGTSPPQTSANTVNALEVRSGAAETPLLLYRGHKQGEGATERTQLSSPLTPFPQAWHLQEYCLPLWILNLAASLLVCLPGVYYAGVRNGQRGRKDRGFPVPCLPEWILSLSSKATQPTLRHLEPPGFLILGCRGLGLQRGLGWGDG